MWKCAQEAISGSGAATDRAAAPMEKTDLGAVLVADGSDCLLCFVERPLTRKNTAVLVAIAVADHHLLDRPALREREDLGAIGLVKGKAALCHRMGKKRLNEPRAALKVVKCLEKRNHRKSAKQALRSPPHEAG